MTFQALADAAIANIGLSWEWTVMLVFICASLIFFAKDFKVGMMILMATMGALFVWFYQKSWNWTLPLGVFFMALVILSLSLFAVNKNSATGGFQ